MQPGERVSKMWDGELITHIHKVYTCTHLTACKSTTQVKVGVRKSVVRKEKSMAPR